MQNANYRLFSVARGILFVVLSSGIAVSQATAQVPAFPGAEGYVALASSMELSDSSVSGAPGSGVAALGSGARLVATDVAVFDSGPDGPPPDPTITPVISPGRVMGSSENNFILMHDRLAGRTLRTVIRCGSWLERPQRVDRSQLRRAVDTHG